MISCNVFCSASSPFLSWSFVSGMGTSTCSTVVAASSMSLVGSRSSLDCPSSHQCATATVSGFSKSFRGGLRRLICPANKPEPFASYPRMLHWTTNQSASGRAVNFAPLSNVLIETGWPLSKILKSSRVNVLSGRPLLAFRAITSTRTRLDELCSVISGESVTGAPFCATAGRVKKLSGSDNSSNKIADGFICISTLHRFQENILKSVAAEVEPSDAHIVLPGDAINVTNLNSVGEDHL